MTFSLPGIECEKIKGVFMTKFVAGIDFGTTNSAAAISDGTAPRMVDVEAGKDTIPTALFFADKNNRVHYGRDAQNEYTNGDGTGRFMRSMKRILGSQQCMVARF